MISIPWRWNRPSSRLCKRPCGRGTWALQSPTSLACAVRSETISFATALCKRLLEDPGITEIIVNGGGVAMDAGVARFLEPHVFVECAGRLEPCPYVRFDDADHLRRIIDKIAEQAGMRCDEAHAMGCAMLPGGKARATYIVPPLAPDGPALNLRLFGDDAMSIEDLTARGALSPVMAEFLGSAVRARCPVIISGGTGLGKDDHARRAFRVHPRRRARLDHRGYA